MNALLALLALAFDRAAPAVQPLRARPWASTYLDMMAEQFGAQSGWGAVVPVLLWVGVPTLGAALLLAFLGSLHPWLAAIAGLVLVLAMFGPACARRAARAHAQALDEDEFEARDDAAERAATSVAQVRDLPAAQLGELYGPALWVLLLGPAGAVLWRISEATPVWLAARADATADDAARLAALVDLRGVLGWLPVRLLAAAFALAGRSDEAFAAWRAWRRPAGLARRAADEALLREVAAAALGERFDAEDRGAHQVWALLALADRVLVVWGVALGLGWLMWSLW
jgi:AmpE protein